MLDKDDFEDFLLMNGGFGTEEKESFNEDIPEVKEDESFIPYLIGGIILYILYIIIF